MPDNYFTRLQDNLQRQKVNNYLTLSNDNTIVNNNSPIFRKAYNKHLDNVTSKGAKTNAVWSEEHPNLNAWGIALGAAPFAVAAIPFGAGAVAAGDAIAGTNLAATVSSSLYPYYSSVANHALTTYGNMALSSVFAAHGLQEMSEGTFTPETALEVLPLGQTIPGVIKTFPEIANTIRRNKAYKQLTAGSRIKRLENLKREYTDYYKNQASTLRDTKANSLFIQKSGSPIPYSQEYYYDNPINLDKLSNDEIIQTYNNLNKKGYLYTHYAPSLEKIKTANGEVVGYKDYGYNPLDVVTTGDYEIPNFITGERIKGRLNIENGQNMAYVTPIGRISLGEEARTVEGIDPIRQVLKDNYNYVVDNIPGFKGFGSSVGVKEGALNHVTHDIDGYITSEDFAKFAKDHPVMKRPLGNAADRVTWEELNKQWNLGIPEADTYLTMVGEGKYGNAGNIDLNIIKVDKNGIGNNRAQELYRQFFPNEYRKSVEKTVTSGGSSDIIPIVDLNGKPLTERQLINKFDPLKKTIMDSMEIPFTSAEKSKHAGRILEYLAGDNPKAVHEALQSTMDEIAQIKKGRLLPKLTFGTKEENIELLKSIGFTGDMGTIAESPEKMQNTLDFWALTDSGMYSRAVNAGDKGEIGGTLDKLKRNITSWNYSNDATSNGHDVGAFLNAVRGAQGKAIGASTLALMQPRILGLTEGMNASDAVNTITRAAGKFDKLISTEDKAEIINLLNKYKFKETAAKLAINKSAKYSDIYLDLPNSGKEVDAFGKELSEKLGINAIGNTSYGREYEGILRTLNDPDDIYGLFGADSFKGFPSWQARMYEASGGSSRSLSIFDNMRKHRSLKITPAKQSYNFFRRDTPEGIQRYEKATDIVNKKIREISKRVNNYERLATSAAWRSVPFRKYDRNIQILKDIGIASAIFSVPVSLILGTAMYYKNKYNKEDKKALEEYKQELERRNSLKNTKTLK